jgi:hemerythrin superfamily protein
MDTAHDAIDVLAHDHRTVESMFVQLEGGASGAARDQIVGQLVRELSVHAAIEEQILYPALRRYLPAESVDHAIDEHQEVKEILAAVDDRDTPPDEADRLLGRLAAHVREHVEEEEVGLFPVLREAVSPEDLREMGEQLTRAKALAPTHPHPHAPNTPPGNVVAGAAAGLVDRARDAMGGGGR